MRSTRSKKMLEMAKPVGTTDQGKIILKIYQFIDVGSPLMWTIGRHRVPNVNQSQFLRNFIIYLTVLP